MPIPQHAPWRGCAANFPPLAVDVAAAQPLVQNVYDFNCCTGDNPLHDIVYRSGSREVDIVHHVFRWDFTPYEEIFRNGFQARRQGDTPDEVYFNLERWVHHGRRPLDSTKSTTHAFLSTTLDSSWHPSLNPSSTTEVELYRYEIYAPGGIWVAQTFGENYRYHAQDEVCFVAGIAPQYIRSAQRFKLNYIYDDKRGRGFTERKRVDTVLYVNLNFNPQSARTIQRAVFDYIANDGSRQPLNFRFWRHDIDADPEQQREEQVSVNSAATTDWYADNDVPDSKNCIDAAFRSTTDEAYLFMQNEYVLLNYIIHRNLNGPQLICDGFLSLRGTTFAEHGIDSAFGSTLEKNSTFIFSGNLCALINYAPGTLDDSIKKGPMTIIGMFPFFKGTVFESGIDAAFESTREPEAYLFKGNQYALINYGPDSHLIGHRLITRGFPSLRSTIFERRIDAAFASHVKNEAYIFKGDSYAVINFAPTSTDYIGGMNKIILRWPCLKCIFPHIRAAFRSPRKNEAYLFMNNEYVLLYYAPYATNNKLIHGPQLICDGFPSLRGTAFGEYGIDCAFGSTLEGEENSAFIFSGNLCALINYAPGTLNNSIKKGPMTIIAMFPFLKGTEFESGVDAAFESTKQPEAYLFKGNRYALINYGPDCHLFDHRLITRGFPSLRGTLFESGIDAAFASHIKDEAYIFKGDSYAGINFAPASTDYIRGGGVKKILSDDWPSLNSILPRENRGLDVDHVHNTEASDSDHDEL